MGAVSNGPCGGARGRAMAGHRAPAYNTHVRLGGAGWLVAVWLVDRELPNWQTRFLASNFPSPFAVLREIAAAEGIDVP